MRKNGRIKRVFRYSSQMLQYSMLRHLGVPRIHSTPYVIKLALTSRCNSRCIMCNYWKFDKVKEVTTEEYKIFLNDAKEAGIRQVQFYGGEPLVRKDIFELVEFSRHLEMSPTIITNGLLLTPKIAEKLVKSGLTHLTVSIQGLKDVHDRVMGMEGIYEKALGGIKAFMEIWKRENGTRPPVTVTAVLMKPTLANENLQNLIKLTEDIGADFCMNIIDPNVPYFGVDGQENLNIVREDIPLVNKLLDEMIKARKNGSTVISSSLSLLYFLKSYFVGDVKEKDIPCPLGFYTIFIDSEGNIHPCSVLKPVGNIKKDKLKDIFQSQKWQRITHDMFFHRCTGCLCGVQRRLIFHLPSAWREITYNILHGRLSF